MLTDASFPNTFEKPIAYLKERAFRYTPELAEEYSIEIAGASACAEYLNRKPFAGDDRIGIVFHYPGSSYCQVRYLGRFRNALMKESPKGVRPHCYIPPARTENQTIYLCESPLKALVLAARGYTAIAAGGVWNFYTRHHNKMAWCEDMPHDMLERMDRAVILFDNDYNTNPDVAHAIRRTGHALMNEHPNLQVLHHALVDPPEDSQYWHPSRGKKVGTWGLDDAVALWEKAGQFDVLHEFLANENLDRDFGAGAYQKHMDYFNDNYVIVKDPVCYVNLDTGVQYKKSDFVGTIEADKTLPGKQTKPMSMAAEWIINDGRSVAEGLDYRPGAAVLYDKNGESRCNTWREDGVAPMEGDITPFTDVYRNAIPDDTVRQLVIQSMAWMLQNRGTKLDKLFLLIGTQVGTGKSLLAQIFGKCYGRNFASITENELNSSFNTAYAAREVVLLDDMTKMNASQWGAQKARVTADTIVVNKKHVSEYEIDNYAVWFITSNDLEVARMEQNERRVLAVHFEPTVHYDTGSEHWNEFNHWLDNDNGYAKVRWWLEQLDVSEFDPAFMPPMTEFKKELIQGNLPENERVILQLIDDPDSLIGEYNERSVYEAKELFIILYGEPPQGSDMREFGKACMKCGLHKANEGKKMKTKGDRSNKTFYIVRGRDKELPYWTAVRVKENIESYALVLGGKNDEKEKY